MKKEYKGFVNIGSAVDKSLSSSFNKYNSAILQIIKNWKSIVGEKYFPYCQPKKISFKKGVRGQGTLRVEACNSAIAMYLDMQEDYILEKIASFFGYRVVSKLRIIQNPRIVDLSKISNEITLDSIEQEDEKRQKEKQKLIDEARKSLPKKVANKEIEKALIELSIEMKNRKY